MYIQNTRIRPGEINRQNMIRRSNAAAETGTEWRGGRRFRVTRISRQALLPLRHQRSDRRIRREKSIEVSERGVGEILE